MTGPDARSELPSQVSVIRAFRCRNRNSLPSFSVAFSRRSEQSLGAVRAARPVSVIFSRYQETAGPFSQVTNFFYRKFWRGSMANELLTN
jgi:hypothetical protein